jgi:hypothetical protein
MFAQLFYIVDTFQCHHNLDKGESQEGSFGLMCSSLMPLDKFLLPGSHLIFFLYD